MPESPDKPTRAQRRLERRVRKAQLKEQGAWYPRWFWPSFAMPGSIALVFLFILPFYTVLAITFGTVNMFQAPVPIWQPWWWSFTAFNEIVGKVFSFGPTGYGPFFIRTFVFVALASLGCLIVGYPIAYFVARYGGRRKAMYLILLISPFWVSYLMRMLAWGNLLAFDGYVNRILMSLHILSEPYRWLDGKPITVICGLIYGYVPYMILPLYAGLDRIPQSLLEGARDLGAGRARTFFRVTLPMSKQAILAGMVINTLPMMGDYYTNGMLATGTSKTWMIGNLIDFNQQNNRQAEAATLVLILTIILLVPMFIYLNQTKESVRT